MRVLHTHILFKRGNNMANKKKILITTLAVLSTTYVGLRTIAKKKQPDSIYDNEPEEKNPLEGKKVVFVEDENDQVNADGVKGHLEAVGEEEIQERFYDGKIKRAFDLIISFFGLVLLSPLFLIISLLIKIEDPGPVFFTQKRVGKNKQYFKLHKFRSMKMNTPHDVPTHMLENPEQYITKTGKFIRAHSLDELPQIWDIFIGNMSIIGPRPALWNQDKLTALRDQYDANNVKPGLTGLAQINGRDELELEEKARLDGEYVKKRGPITDAKIFIDSLGVFGGDSSIVEGGTGKEIGRSYTKGKTNEELIGHIGFGQPVVPDLTACKHVLIVGKNSYIGETFKEYASHYYKKNYVYDVVDSIPDNSGVAEYEQIDFSKYDIVYHVAGIAHADVSHVSDEVKEKYYQVNTDLALRVAKKAKNEGVPEFIFMSSMIVYGDSAPYGKEKIITSSTVPSPSNFYGDSKLQADVAIRELADDTFKVIVLRPPMIYGKNSKGNYPLLAKMAKKLPIFPYIDNKRSQLYVGNLCEFLCQIMLVDMRNSQTNDVVLFPQNSDYVRTSDLVREIAITSHKPTLRLRILSPFVALASHMPGKIGRLKNKAFGNNIYDMAISQYEGIDYQKVDLRESIILTEGR